MWSCLLLVEPAANSDIAVRRIRNVRSHQAWQPHSRIRFGDGWVGAPSFRKNVSEHSAPSYLKSALAQFGTEEMGEGGANIRVGDAFLVKYATAGGSKHIPVHRDYSTHSLTIALNPSSEYDGGGTYFCDLGRSLRPELGHVVSLSGDLVHGGDPITRGVRYIVATFLYVDKGAGGLAGSTAVAAKSGSVDLGWLRPMLRTKGVASVPPLVVEPGSRWDFPPILEVADEAEAEWVAHWESSRDELREKGATEGQESRADPGATEGDSTSTGGNDDMVSADCDDLDTGSFSWLMSLGSGDE